MSAPSHRRELLLVNLGTPAAPTAQAVRAFLAEFLSDPLVVTWPRWLWLPVLNGVVLRRRPAKVAELYASIWTEEGSPLRAGTLALARAVQEHAGEGELVTPAFRYGDPPLATLLERAAARAERVAVLPLFPQRTASSSGSVERLAERVARAGGWRERLDLVRLAPDEPGYVAACAARARLAQAQLGGEADRLLVSLHGIPDAVDRREGRRYSRDCEATFAALRAELGWPAERASLCYQSRFGPGRWLLPATAETLVALARGGAPRVLVVAPGFLTDGIETLEELGQRGRADFLAAGGAELALAAAPAAEPALAAALARRAGLSGAPPPPVEEKSAR